MHSVLRDGDLWVAETGPGVFAVTWWPHREDHPDFPGVTIESSRNPMPIEGGLDVVSDWAHDRFDGRDPRDLLEVHLDVGADEQEIAAVSRAYDEAGVPAIVTASIVRRSAITELLPWTMVVKVSLTVFLLRFANNAADDAYRALQTLIRRVYEARRGRPGSICLEDGERKVILTDEVPDEGLRELVEGKLDAPGYYVWDAGRGVWRRH